MRQWAEGLEGIPHTKTMSLPDRLSTKAEQSILTYSLFEPIQCKPSSCHKTKPNQPTIKQKAINKKEPKSNQKNAESQLKAILPGLLVRLGSLKMQGLLYLWGWEHTVIRFFFQQKQSRKACLLFSLSVGSQEMMYG